MSEPELPITIELRNLRSNSTWLEFMEKIHQELPFLYEKGRPTNQLINESIIGQSGCSSWTQYLNQQLDWNEHGWKAWRRAYKMVQAYPYLQDVKATPSLINLRARTIDPFPTDNETWHRIQESLNEKVHESRIVKLEKRVHELEQELKKLKQ